MILLRTVVRGEFQLSLGRLGPTEGHVLLVLLGVSAAVTGPTVVYDVLTLATAALVLVHCVTSGTREAIRLRRAPAQW